MPHNLKMPELNSVTISGRLTRNAELTYTGTGTAILKFSVAHARRVKRGNQWEDDTHYFDCVMFGKVEGLEQKLVKGRAVIVEGRLNQERWESNGEKRSKVGIIAWKTQDIEWPDDGPRGSGVTPEPPRTQKQADIDDSIPDDDIPF